MRTPNANVTNVPASVQNRFEQAAARGNAWQPSEYLVDSIAKAIETARRDGLDTIEVPVSVSNKYPAFGWPRLFGPLQRPSQVNPEATRMREWLEGQGFKVSYRLSASYGVMPQSNWEMFARLPQSLLSAKP